MAVEFGRLLEMLRSKNPELVNEAERRLHEQFYEVVHVVISAMLWRNPDLRLSESTVLWDSMILTLRDKRIDPNHEDPGKLLATIVRNKILNEIRHARQGGDARVQQLVSDDDIAATSRSPSEEASESELRAIYDRCREELSQRENDLLDLLTAGESWATIAQKLGFSSEGAARMTVTRLKVRLSRKLRLK